MHSISRGATQHAIAAHRFEGDRRVHLVCSETGRVDDPDADGETRTKFAQLLVELEHKAKGSGRGGGDDGLDDADGVGGFAAVWLRATSATVLDEVRYASDTVGDSGAHPAILVHSWRLLAAERAQKLLREIANALRPDYVLEWKDGVGGQRDVLVAFVAPSPAQFGLFGSTCGGGGNSISSVDERTGGQRSSPTGGDDGSSTASADDRGGNWRSRRPILLEARYGDPEYIPAAKADVTAAVARHWEAILAHSPPSSLTPTDPAPWVMKQLCVRYVDRDGHVRDAFVNERVSSWQSALTLV